MTIGIDTSFLVAWAVSEHPGHQNARKLFLEATNNQTTFALCPQVLAEFIHVITDANRFERPLSMLEALSRAEGIWNAKEIRRTYPSEDAAALFLHWMKQHRLGRMRILDTQLAAVYYTAKVKEIATTDFRDFQVFAVFKIHNIG